MVEGFLPAGFGRLGGGGPVLTGLQGGDFGALQALGWDRNPDRDMENEFPYGVGIGDGAPGSGLVSYIGQHCAECGAMPGVSFISAVELVEDAGGFGHGCRTL